MNNFIIYTIETGVCFALFYLAYWLFLKNETFFKLNRFYLIASIIVSLSLPLFNVSVSTTPGENSFIANLILPVEEFEQNILGGRSHPENNKPAYFLRNKRLPALDRQDKKETEVPATAATIQKTNDSAKSINWLTIALTVYAIGAILFFLRFLINLILIAACVLKNGKQEVLGVKVIKLDKNTSPFSFLNFIFLSNKDYPEAELVKIISHEKVHIQQKHSIDVILLELLLVFQWFNPFVWLYRRALKITHEYLADHGTLDSGVDLKSYQYSLLNQVLTEKNFDIASTYNLSIKKRIAMMIKKRSSRLAMLKLIIALPILGFLFGAFAINAQPLKSDEKVIAEEATISKDSTIKKVPVSIEYLRLLEGEYVSTNEPGRTRRIIFTEVLGKLIGTDAGYTYSLIPVGGGKFINPDDNASLVFDTKDKNAISLLLFGKINLNKVKAEPGEHLNRSLAFSLVRIIVKDGPEAALAYSKACKDSTNLYLTETELNYAGYELMQAGKYKEAATLLKMNVDLNQASFNAYDSYAEALLSLGDKSGAIENYKESVKLNPGSQNGLKKLKELGVDPASVVKIEKVSKEYLKLLEGDYLSTNQPGWMRWIRFTEENGVLYGHDNGYRYKLIPMGEGKFINPDDGASLVFDTKDKESISLLLFRQITLKKVKTAKEPLISLKNYAGKYKPEKKDTVLKEMVIVEKDNKLYRWIESEPRPENRNVELILVTDHTFFYSDNSPRSIVFTVNEKNQVTGCVLRRWDGVFHLTKQE